MTQRDPDLLIRRGRDLVAAARVEREARARTKDSGTWRDKLAAWAAHSTALHARAQAVAAWEQAFAADARPDRTHGAGT